jgi:hypothetical protein
MSTFVAVPYRPQNTGDKLRSFAVYQASSASSPFSAARPLLRLLKNARQDAYQEQRPLRYVSRIEVPQRHILMGTIRFFNWPERGEQRSEHGIAVRVTREGVS